MTQNFPVKWIPFHEACRFRSLQQGTLGSGNTTQNIATLLALATAEANSPTTGWAKWRGGVNMTKHPRYLMVQVRLVPGYTPPAGTGYQAVAGGSGVAFTLTSYSDLGPIGFQTNGIPGFPAGSQGSLSPSTLNGDTIAALEYNSLAIHLVVQAAVAQNFFTQLRFTDRASNIETYLSANATYSQSSGAHTFWTWTSQYAGEASPFSPTDGTPYTIYIS